MSNSFCLCLDKVSAHHHVCVWSIWKKSSFYTSKFVPFIKDDDLAHEIVKLKTKNVEGCRDVAVPKTAQTRCRDGSACTGKTDYKGTTQVTPSLHLFYA